MKIKYQINEYVDGWFEIIDTDMDTVVFKEKNISKEFVISIADRWNKLIQTVDNKISECYCVSETERWNCEKECNNKPKIIQSGEC
jgi:hypothetical protein